MKINSNRAKIVKVNRKNRQVVRLSVFRSNLAIDAILIDDVKGVVIASINSSKLADSKLKPIEKAGQVGKLIAEKAKELKITTVIFDRNSYKYHGRVKALAEGARSAGLKF